METQKKSTMKHMSLQKISQVCKGELYVASGSEGDEITCAVLDSRKIEEGGLFIATLGERVDGHRFIGEIFAQGALCVVSEKTPSQVEAEHGIPPSAWGSYILVENTLSALQEIAAYYRNQLSLPVVGITGSVGKTSTKEMIAGVLHGKRKVLKTQGNYNNEIGLPITLLRIREEHEVAVLEMGISDFGEMHRLSRMAQPDICVLTNIGQSHLNNLKSREGILKAKSEIFDFMAEDGCVCVNGDDDLLATLDTVKGRAVLRFGLAKEGNHIYATEIENKGMAGSRARICERESGVSYPVEITLPGRHMVLNATAAAMVAGLLGLSREEIQEGLSHVEAVGGRSHVISTTQYTLIDDCYNANPVSMKAALDLLQSALTRKVAVLGDMFNLGENSDEMHREVGRYAIESGVDVLLCVGENAKYLYDAALNVSDGTVEICYFNTLEELLTKLPVLLLPQDTVLIKASHDMHFAEVLKALE